MFDGQRAVEVGEADHLGLGLMRAVPFPFGSVEQRPLGVNFFSLLPFATARNLLLAERP